VATQAVQLLEVATDSAPMRAIFIAEAFLPVFKEPFQSFVRVTAGRRQRIRIFDWADTSIGPIERWSPGMRSIVSLMLANRFPILLWWGPALCVDLQRCVRTDLGRQASEGLGSTGP
jgi:hypothetical protein